MGIYNSLCRHENIVLFMGACTTPPKLAIVMEWCAGATLYNELHTKDNDETEGLSLVECMDIALQTARGMGYALIVSLYVHLTIWDLCLFITCWA
jgi:serine/threonine protein kinase